MKILKIIGIIILIIIVVFVIVLFVLSKMPSAPTDYETSIETGGELEAKYLAHGKYDVSCYEQEVDEDFEKYEVYYPTNLINSNDTYPVIVMANGSGVRGSKNKTVFEHCASWGFIVVGNEDDTSWSGLSSDMSLQYILDENNNSNSVLYSKVDIPGIVGHSQGGVGVINAITNQSNKDVYKTAVALSPTSDIIASKINWPYDISKVDIPLLMLAGDTGEFETEMVIPLSHLVDMYNKVDSEKVMARRVGNDHSQMLYASDGYVTAWLLYQLQGDKEAAKVFIGDNPEIVNNKMYSDLNIDI